MIWPKDDSVPRWWDQSNLVPELGAGSEDRVLCLRPSHPDCVLFHENSKTRNQTVCPSAPLGKNGVGVTSETETVTNPAAPPDTLPNRPKLQIQSVDFALFLLMWLLIPLSTLIALLFQLMGIYRIGRLGVPTVPQLYLVHRYPQRFWVCTLNVLLDTYY